MPRVGAGLYPVKPSLEITLGMTFIVKYFNHGKNKQDLWLGVHVPQDLAPRQMISRPRKNAHPDTPADKRAYLFYLPGKNAYVWADRKCLFPLEEEPYADFMVPGAEDGVLYQKLHDLMREGKDLEFWVAMAKKERSQKGIQNKEPGLVIPSDTDMENEMAFDTDDASIASFDQKTSKPRASSKASNGFLQPALPTPAPVDPEESVDVYVGHGGDHKVFHLTRGAISKSSILCQIVQGSPPYVMHPILFHMETRAFGLVHAFICSETEELGLEEVGEEDAAGQDDILGDVLVLGKTYVLRGFDSAEHDDQSLNSSIFDLGKTYLIASSLGLGSMQTAIIRRLQVTWNTACGIGQILAILETIDAVANAIYTANPGYRRGDLSKDEPFLNWTVGFLSDLFMVFVTKYTERFTGFMQKYLEIQAAVLAQRAHNCSSDALRLLHLEILFMMGPERVVENGDKQDEAMA
ncbi:hypothetical protein PISL3812_09623 [Talaromyces islandicus]|uniref:Uncharacterized protein n=1 Tax=Talaromyces islandicus TaxID=28573 RepID=A0A0U1MBU1_TALIS|nr:hypothetical protein PISL3812_09623 [Talaromyces islandicus]